MRRSKSSKHWLKEHEEDQWVKRAREEGYRSRASYKLLEIQKSDKLFKPGMTVVDLGAAPGGWSQVASKLVGRKGKVIASDILFMEDIPEVCFIRVISQKRPACRPYCKKLGEIQPLKKVL